MTLDEAKKAMVKFVELKTTLRPAFVDPILKAKEVKHGEWIYGEHDMAMCDGYWCDQCGFFVPWDYEHKFIDFIKDYHWCPSCGAKMDGERRTDETG